MSEHDYKKRIKEKLEEVAELKRGLVVTQAIASLHEEILARALEIKEDDVALDKDSFKKTFEAKISRCYELEEDEDKSKSKFWRVGGGIDHGRPHLMAEGGRGEVQGPAAQQQQALPQQAAPQPAAPQQQAPQAAAQPAVPSGEQPHHHAHKRRRDPNDDGHQEL